MIEIQNLIIYSMAFVIIFYMLYDAIKVSIKKDEKHGKHK